MMWEHAGVREDPFGAVPDPRFLYLTKGHREALASLRYGFMNNRGFTSLIAEPGLGKTTLLVTFLERIRTTARTVFLFDTQCDAGELLAYILHDLGITPGPDRVAQHEQLHAVLVAEARAGRKVVVVIDEAQNLSPDALEAVRMLSNFETPSAKLLQIVLAGQLQLGDRLSSPDMAQLRQRISTVCRLAPFTMHETAEYISHRLMVAGYRGSPLFTNAAVEAIQNASKGIPRIVNHLCFNALSLSYALRRKQVDVETVDEVVADQELTTTRDSVEVVAPTEVVPSGRPTTDLGAKAVRWVFAVGALVALAILAAWGAHHTHVAAAPDAARTSIAPATVARVPTSTLETEADLPYLEVTVQPNETITDIASKNLGAFNDRVLREIKALNPRLADNPDHIEAGQQLRLPRNASAPAFTRIDQPSPKGARHEP